MAAEDHLAYGDLPNDGRDGERGMIGDTYRKIRGTHSGGIFSSFLNTIQQTVQDFGTEITGKVSGQEIHSHTHTNANCTDGIHSSPHRFGSFADARDGNNVKWYVDGCSYMWAISRALEQARDSIWILDCKDGTQYYDRN